MRVLVVHRQEAAAKAIRLQLDQWSCDSILAFNGLDGLLEARDRMFDLIICTVDLPIITGVEMIRAIRNFSTNLLTPVIFLEHKSTSSYKDIYNKLGAISISTHEKEDKFSSLNDWITKWKQQSSGRYLI